MSKASSSFNKNPLNLSYNSWNTIASFLPTPQDLVNFGQVATLLREISKNEQLWLNLHHYQTIGLKYRRAPYKDVTLYVNGDFIWRKEINQDDDKLDLQENDRKFWHIGWKQDDTARLAGHVLRLQLFINHPLQHNDNFGRSIVDYHSAVDPRCALDLSFKADRSPKCRDASMYERNPSLERPSTSRFSPIWAVPAVPEFRTNDWTMIIKVKIDDPINNRNIIFGQWASLWMFMITMEKGATIPDVHLRKNLYTPAAIRSGRLSIGSEPSQGLSYGKTITSEDEAVARDERIRREAAEVSGKTSTPAASSSSSTSCSVM